MPSLKKLNWHLKSANWRFQSQGQSNANLAQICTHYNFSARVNMKRLNSHGTFFECVDDIVIQELERKFKQDGTAIIVQREDLLLKATKSWDETYQKPSFPAGVNVNRLKTQLSMLLHLCFHSALLKSFSSFIWGMQSEKNFWCLCPSVWLVRNVYFQHCVVWRHGFAPQWLKKAHTHRTFDACPSGNYKRTGGY